MKKVIKPVLISAIFFLVLSGVSLASFYLAYQGKIIAGVRINKFPLENRTLSMTQSLLDKYFEAYSSNGVVILVDGEKVSLQQAELGFVYDAQATAQRAYAVGREGSLLNRTKEIFKAFRYGYDLKPAFDVNDDMMKQRLQALSQEFSTPHQDASFVLIGTNLNLVAEKKGRVLETEGLRSAIVSNLSEFKFSPITTTFTEFQPEVTISDLEFFRGKVISIIQMPWEFSVARKTLKPTQEELLAMVEVRKLSDLSEPELLVNERGVKAYFEKHRGEVETPAREGIFEVVTGRVVKFEPPVNGVGIDDEKALENTKQALLNMPVSKSIEVPVIVTYAPGLANDYGIHELLGEGKTQFRGSSAGRVHNIGLAASRASGTLVPPGGTFSFNQSVGEITIATGYDQAYIIADRRTVMGTGGGVCQVSTTVFRAGLNAGLEIVERHPHSYRVGYYEPPGMDASVYYPSSDLKLKNNTGQHILFYYEFNPSKYELTFRVYGTNDGREVTMLGPQISGNIAPPEPIHQDDSSLPKGTTKQVDFAAWGAKVSVQRMVRLNGADLINETIYSSYAPWQAIFLVGTKE